MRAPSDAGASLRTYRDKRQFEHTPEPAPAPSGQRHGPLLFVVQQHAARHLHWDFRLEVDGVLKSWAVPKGPSLDPADKRLAVQTEDHPFEYASFEEVIPPKQYGAGEVIVWDCGLYSPDDEDETSYHDREAALARLRAAFERGKLSIELRGEKLKGSWALVRTKQAGQWFLIKHRDRFVATEPPPGWERSVLSGMAVEALRTRAAGQAQDASELAPYGPAERFPARLQPMLAELGSAPFTQPGWLYEPKLDGYRALAFVHEGRATLRSRRGLELTRHFPRIIAELEEQGVGALVLDGEIVALDRDGKPSFNALQNRAQLDSAAEIAAADRGTPALFYCFDLLHFAGLNLREAPYEARRRYLAQCLLPGEHVKRVDAHEDGEALMRVALAHGFEGVMAKRRVTRPPAAAAAAAVQQLPGNDSAGGELVAQVLEQLDASGRTLELQVGAERVRVTNLDRVYWPAAPKLRQPALTKRDLLHYLTAVSPYMLPHLADRPLTMIRFPQGIGGERFFQKHWEQTRPQFVQSVEVWSESKAQRDEYLLCNDLPTLLWLAQGGILEFHVWHSRARPGPDTGNDSTDYSSSLDAMERSLLNFPDYLVFDIDPYIYSGKEKKGAEPELNDAAFAKGKEVAFHLRTLLREMRLEAIVKTSGKTGLHVQIAVAEVAPEGGAKIIDLMEALRASLQRAPAGGGRARSAEAEPEQARPAKRASKRAKAVAPTRAETPVRKSARRK